MTLDWSRCLYAYCFSHLPEVFDKAKRLSHAVPAAPPHLQVDNNTAITDLSGLTPKLKVHGNMERLGLQNLGPRRSFDTNR